MTDSVVDTQSLNVFGDYSLRLDPTVNAGRLTVTLIAPEGDFTA